MTVQPSFGEVSDAIRDAISRSEGCRDPYHAVIADKAADAVLALIGGRADAEIKAEARSLAAASARFWRLVDVGSKTECWPWQGSVLPFGHGQFVGPFGSSTAHRYAWAIVHAEMPETGLVVRHRCDNPICCNPSHLEIGTQAENVADMINRGRASFTPTTCRKGHPRTPDNTLTKADGTRRCKTCSREQQRARWKSLAVLRCPECRHVANVYNLRRHLIRVHGIAESATALHARAAAIRDEQP